MKTEVAVRKIEDMDVDAVVTLWADSGLLRPWNDPRHDIAFARQSANSTVLVGTEGTVIVATAMIGHDGHRGWLYYIASAPSKRGQGIGRLIVETAERWLADRGIWKVQLLVRSGNHPVEAFYEKLGYADTQSKCFQKVLSR